MIMAFRGSARAAIALPRWPTVSHLRGSFFYTFDVRLAQKGQPLGQLTADFGRLQRHLQLFDLLLQFRGVLLCRRRQPRRAPQKTRLQTVQRRLEHLAAHLVEHRLLNPQRLAGVRDRPLAGQRFQDDLQPLLCV
jgi:hypothetical protein